MRRISAIVKTKHRRHIKRILAATLLISCLIHAVGIVPANAATQWQVSLTLNQTILGRVPITSAQTVTYELIPKTENAPMPYGSASDKHTFAATGTGEVYIGTIGFNTAGVYTYQLRCISEGRNLTIDKSVYTLEIYVINGQEAVALVYINADTKLPDMSFVHTYNTPIGGGSGYTGYSGRDPEIIKIDNGDGVFVPLASGDMVDVSAPPVIKTVDGSPATSAVFTFELKAENSEYPMPDGSANGVKRISIIGSGSAEFGAWNYEVEGTYRYTVSEINTGVDGYIYDANAYTIRDEVVLEGGQLLVFRSITDSTGVQASSFDFVNIYKEAPAEITPETINQTGRATIGPKTGDFSNPALWTALIITSGIMLAILILIGKRSSRRKGRREQ